MKYLIAILSIFTIISCGWLAEDEPFTVHDPEIIAAAEKRLERYMQVKMENCRNDLKERVEMKVDSAIAELYKNTDTTYFPIIPKKPSFPTKLIEDSTLLPAPLLDSVPKIKSGI